MPYYKRPDPAIHVPRQEKGPGSHRTLCGYGGDYPRMMPVVEWLKLDVRRRCATCAKRGVENARWTEVQQHAT